MLSKCDRIWTIQNLNQVSILYYSLPSAPVHFRHDQSYLIIMINLTHIFTFPQFCKEDTAEDGAAGPLLCVEVTKIRQKNTSVSSFPTWLWEKTRRSRMLRQKWKRKFYPNILDQPFLNFFKLSFQTLQFLFSQIVIMISCTFPLWRPIFLQKIVVLGNILIFVLPGNLFLQFVVVMSFLCISHCLTLFFAFRLSWKSICILLFPINFLLLLRIVVQDLFFCKSS